MFSAMVCLMFAMDGKWDWDLFLVLFVGTVLVMGVYFMVQSRMTSFVWRNEKAIEIIIAVILIAAFLMGIRFIPSNL